MTTTNILSFAKPIKPADREQTYRCTNCGAETKRAWRLDYCDALIPTEWPFKKGWISCGAEMRPVEGK